MGFTEKTNYLKDSKEILRNALQDLGADIDAETPFRQYMKDNIIDTIWNNAKKVSAEGSNIMLQGAAAGKITITPKGNTEQETTNGYNLLPYKNTTQTRNGLTFTNHGDGTFTINGTASAQTIYCINAESIAGTILDMRLEATNYKITVGQTMSNSTFLVQLAYRKPDETIGYAQVVTDGGTINNLTIKDADNNAGFGLIIREGTSFDNMLIKPMLQLATTSYDYEQYTGGMPSPNPDYPQKVKVVKGNNNIIISGKNLFNIETVQNYYLNHTNGTTSANNGWRTSDFINIKNIEQLTFSWDNSSYFFFQVNVAFYDINKNFISGLTYQRSNVYNTTFEVADNAYYCRIAYSIKVGNNDALRKNIQLEEGSVVTDYEEYIEPIEKELNLTSKNLFDGIWESGSISDTNGTAESNNRVIRSKNYISVKPNTEYTVSAENNVSIFIYYYDENKTYISVNNTRVTPKTFTTPINAYYVRIRTRQSEDVTDTSLKCQLEKGPTATSYEIYYNYELAKNDDYSDLIFKNEKSNPYYNNALMENGWYEKQIVNSRLYNGTENFQLGLASTNDYYIFQTAYRDDLADSKEGGELVCDNFVFNRTEGNYQKEYVSLNANAYTYVRFHISANRLSEKSVNAFKNWLETHNVLIYYILENPIYTQITDTTLISQLEEINSIIGQGGTVVIETESKEENAQLIVNASALQKI